MYATYCRAGSEWSCRELDRLGPGGAIGALAGARESTSAGASGVKVQGSATPPLEDLPIVLRGSKGPISDRRPASLRTRACAQGWLDSCGEPASSGVE